MNDKLQTAAAVFSSLQMKMFPESQKTTLGAILTSVLINLWSLLSRTNTESQTLGRAVNVVGTNLNLVTCGFIVLFMKTFINVLSRAPFCNCASSPHPVCVTSPVTLRPLIGHLHHPLSSDCPRSLAGYQDTLDLGRSSVPKYCHKIQMFNFKFVQQSTDLPSNLQSARRDAVQ